MGQIGHHIRKRPHFSRGVSQSHRLHQKRNSEKRRSTYEDHQREVQVSGHQLQTPQNRCPPNQLEAAVLETRLGGLPHVHRHEPRLQRLLREAVGLPIQRSQHSFSSHCAHQAAQIRLLLFDFSLDKAQHFEVSLVLRLTTKK